MEPKLCQFSLILNTVAVRSDIWCFGRCSHHHAPHAWHCHARGRCFFSAVWLEYAQAVPQVSPSFPAFQIRNRYATNLSRSQAQAQSLQCRLFERHFIRMRPVTSHVYHGARCRRSAKRRAVVTLFWNRHPDPIVDLRHVRQRIEQQDPKSINGRIRYSGYPDGVDDGRPGA